MFERAIIFQAMQQFNLCASQQKVGVWKIRNKILEGGASSDEATGLANREARLAKAMGRMLNWKKSHKGLHI